MGGRSESIICRLQWLLGPIWFAKLYALLALLILGLGARVALWGYPHRPCDNFPDWQVTAFLVVTKDVS
jgi:hypothetical protein